jgi:hypothetical protein
MRGTSDVISLGQKATSELGARIQSQSFSTKELDSPGFHLFGVHSFCKDFGYNLILLFSIRRGTCAA